MRFTLAQTELTLSPNSRSVERLIIQAESRRALPDLRVCNQKQSARNLVP